MCNHTNHLSFTECTIRGIDCVFVIDTSGSIDATEFQMIREFTASLVQLLSIGPQESLVGTILFSTNAIVHFDIPTHPDIASLSAAFDPNLPPFQQQGTNTAGALNLLVSSAQGGPMPMNLRPGFPAIAIVITDGQSNDRARTLASAQAVHASNIFQQVYAVGVGNADVTELNAIASDLSLVFNTNSFDSTAIQQLQQSLSQRLCDSKVYLNNTF